MTTTASIQPGPLPNLEAVRALVRHCRGPLVTLYVPLLRSLPGARSNAAAWEGAVSEAERRLEQAGLPAAQAQAVGKQLLAVETDLRRLTQRAAGVAAFCDRAELNAYGLTEEPARRVVVGESFALRPLLAEVQRNRRHLVLALSTNRVALFEGDALGLEPILARGVPTSLEDALGSELSSKELRVATTQGGAGAPKYFSHDSGRDERKLDLERFHSRIARAIETALRDRKEPLVLVATQAHHSGLRAALHLANLLPAGVQTSPDHLSTSELHARTWPLIEGAVAAEHDALGPAFERAVNRGKGLHRIDDVAAAAAAGRVRRLWVTRDERMPGGLDLASGALIGGRPEEDVLDALVTLVLRHGGDVIVGARIPSATSLAAELH